MRRPRPRCSPPTATRWSRAARTPIWCSWPSCACEWRAARARSSISEFVRRARVRYAKAFFDLQLRFAHTVMTLSGLPLSRVLLEYTNLYIRFGLGRDFDAEHPTWQAYLAGLKGGPDIHEWTYDFYVTRHHAMAGPTVVATVGCFSYAPLSAERIRLTRSIASGEWRSWPASSRVSSDPRAPLCEWSARRGCTTSRRIAACSRSRMWPRRARSPVGFSICPCGDSFWIGTERLEKR